MWEMLPILLSIGLFVLTLIIIFTLRSSDSRNRRLDIMRRYVAQYMAEVKRSEDHLKETVVEVDSRVAQSRQELDDLLSHITAQRDLLITHSEDLDELQKTLTYYHEVLGQLGAMTEKAELRTRQVKDEVTKVEQVRQTIEEFMTRTTASEERLNQLANRLNHAVEQHGLRIEQQVEESVAEAKTKIEYLLDDSLNHTDATFQTMITTVQAFLRELNNRTEILEEVVKRLTGTAAGTLGELSEGIKESQGALALHDRSLADLSKHRKELELAVESLSATKEELEKSMDDASTQLREKHAHVVELEQQSRSLQDELDLALAERQRMLEEEERRELEMRARMVDPELHEEESQAEPEHPFGIAMVQQSDDPELDEPELDEPELDEPELDEPELDEPELDEPELDEPELDEPELDEPELDEPELDEPELDEPELDEPELDEPELEEPDDAEDSEDQWEEDRPRKIHRIESAHYEPEEDEEEIILDEDSENS
ncbi:MAG: hypothetical protein RBT44_05920 [Sphaerochaetaceae bacterium]|jgi:chromosome segregation ATPase|nr:hypothetical protein [Sphaerochaetaceae bacterium]